MSAAGAAACAPRPMSPYQASAIGARNGRSPAAAYRRCCVHRRRAAQRVDGRCGRLGRLGAGRRHGRHLAYERDDRRLSGIRQQRDWVVIALDADAGLLFFTTMTAAGVLDRVGRFFDQLRVGPPLPGGQFLGRQRHRAARYLHRHLGRDPRRISAVSGYRLSAAGAVFVAGTLSRTIDALTAQAAGTSGTVVAPPHGSPAVP
jgi:hypothetical protein